MLGINKFGADGDIVVSFQHAAGENGVDAKFAGDRGRIDGLALITVRGRQRNDFKVRELRKRADEILGNSLAEIFGVRIARCIYKRKHGDGIHGGLLDFLSAEEQCQRQNHGDGKTRSEKTHAQFHVPGRGRCSGSRSGGNTR